MQHKLSSKSMVPLPRLSNEIDKIPPPPPPPPPPPQPPEVSKRMHYRQFRNTQNQLASVPVQTVTQSAPTNSTFSSWKTQSKKVDDIIGSPPINENQIQNDKEQPCKGIKSTIIQKHVRPTLNETFLAKGKTSAIHEKEEVSLQVPDFATTNGQQLEHGHPNTGPAPLANAIVPARGRQMSSFSKSTRAQRANIRSLPPPSPESRSIVVKQENKHESTLQSSATRSSNLTHKISRNLSEKKTTISPRSRRQAVISSTSSFSTTQTCNTEDDADEIEEVTIITKRRSVDFSSNHRTTTTIRHEECHEHYERSRSRSRSTLLAKSTLTSLSSQSDLPSSSHDLHDENHAEVASSLSSTRFQRWRNMSLCSSPENKKQLFADNSETKHRSSHFNKFSNMSNDVVDNATTNETIRNEKVRNPSMNASSPMVQKKTSIPIRARSCSPHRVLDVECKKMPLQPPPTAPFVRKTTVRRPALVIQTNMNENSFGDTSNNDCISLQASDTKDSQSKNHSSINNVLECRKLSLARSRPSLVVGGTSSLAANVSEVDEKSSQQIHSRIQAIGKVTPVTQKRGELKSKSTATETMQKSSDINATATVSSDQKLDPIKSVSPLVSKDFRRQYSRSLVLSMKNNNDTCKESKISIVKTKNTVTVPKTNSQNQNSDKNSACLPTALEQSPSTSVKEVTTRYRSPLPKPETKESMSRTLEKSSKPQRASLEQNRTANSNVLSTSLTPSPLISTTTSSVVASSTTPKKYCRPTFNTPPKPIASQVVELQSESSKASSTSIDESIDKPKTGSVKSTYVKPSMHKNPYSPKFNHKFNRQQVEAPKSSTSLNQPSVSLDQKQLVMDPSKVGQVHMSSSPVIKSSNKQPSKRPQMSSSDKLVEARSIDKISMPSVEQTLLTVNTDSGRTTKGNQALLESSEQKSSMVSCLNETHCSTLQNTEDQTHVVKFNKVENAQSANMSTVLRRSHARRRGDRTRKQGLELSGLRENGSDTSPPEKINEANTSLKAPELTDNSLTAANEAIDDIDGAIAMPVVVHNHIVNRIDALEYDGHSSQHVRTFASEVKCETAERSEQTTKLELIETKTNKLATASVCQCEDKVSLEHIVHDNNSMGDSRKLNVNVDNSADRIYTRTNKSENENVEPLQIFADSSSSSSYQGMGGEWNIDYERQSSMKEVFNGHPNPTIVTASSLYKFHGNSIDPQGIKRVCEKSLRQANREAAGSSCLSPKSSLSSDSSPKHRNISDPVSMKTRKYNTEKMDTHSSHNRWKDSRLYFDDKNVENILIDPITKSNEASTVKTVSSMFAVNERFCENSTSRPNHEVHDYLDSCYDTRDIQREKPTEHIKRDQGTEEILLCKHTLKASVAQDGLYRKSVIHHRSKKNRPKELSIRPTEEVLQNDVRCNEQSNKQIADEEQTKENVVHCEVHAPTDIESNISTVRQSNNGNVFTALRNKLTGRVDASVDSLTTNKVSADSPKGVSTPRRPSFLHGTKSSFTPINEGNEISTPNKVTLVQKFFGGVAKKTRKNF